MNEVKEYIKHLQKEIYQVETMILNCCFFKVEKEYYHDKWKNLKGNLLDVKNASKEMYINNELVDEEKLLKISKKYPFMSHESRMFLGLPELVYVLDV